MIPDFQDVWANAVQSSRHPLPRLPDLLDALMRALMQGTRAAGGSLRLEGVGSLILHGSGPRLAARWTDRSPPAPLAEPGAALAVPVGYAGTPIGEIRLDWDAPGAAPREPPALMRAYARQCGFLVKRQEVERWAGQRLGRPLRFVGLGRALRELEAVIETAAGSALPVLVTGEFGTEKAQVAAAIHGGGPRRDGPFIPVRCAAPEGGPALWFERARGGTLFLDDIDELAPPLQSQIPPRMLARPGDWLPDPDDPAPRVIAATTATATALSRRVEEGRFSRALLAALDVLPVTVPPLRERADDMEALVAAALERNGRRCARDTRTGDLVALCRAYAWPENAAELDRVIARLAAMTGDSPIGPADVGRHAPWMVAAAASAATAAPADIDRWVRGTLAGDAALLAPLHAGLKKALAYLGDHYAEPVSLDQLARQSHVSRSHLGYLFRTGLQTSFKTLLGRMRIEEAKRMLAADARRPITEVALSVGFADLSHFEKCFRRIVGQSPREFRRAAAQPPARPPGRPTGG